jgi:CHAT domain-containing protein
MPLGGVFPPPPRRRSAAAGAQKRRMLLIHSDPKGDLPAAAREADEIANALSDKLEIERVDPDQATNAHINDILMGKPFDFLHYAGHAYFDKKDPNLSGLQLKDSRLTAEKIRRLNKGGSLVFLNACESGTVARDSEAQQVSYLLSNPEPVVGLASAFVYSGALGCVGSLWPVYDRPAAELAVKFYEYVLLGEPTGEALRKARNDIRVLYPREVTWAGYVLYGDPTFRLTET